MTTIIRMPDCVDFYIQQHDFICCSVKKCKRKISTIAKNILPELYAIALCEKHFNHVSNPKNWEKDIMLEKCNCGICDGYTEAQHRSHQLIQAILK